MGRQKQTLRPELQRKADALGLRLRAARRRRGMTAAELSARALVSRPTLERLERGDLSVTSATLARVLDVLSLADDLDRLAERDEIGHQIADARLPTPRRERDRGLADEL